jgi:hypothetical protein
MPSTTSIMPYAPPENASPDEIAKILAKLEILLTGLPSQLPYGDDYDSKYSAFSRFLWDEYMERTRDEVATLSEKYRPTIKSRSINESVLHAV